MDFWPIQGERLVADLVDRLRYLSQLVWPYVRKYHVQQQCAHLSGHGSSHW